MTTKKQTRIEELFEDAVYFEREARLLVLRAAKAALALAKAIKPETGTAGAKGTAIDLAETMHRRAADLGTRSKSSYAESWALLKKEIRSGRK